MFNKLKSFSEDVAKSLNDIQQGDLLKKRTGDKIQRLKNGQNLLNQKTPEISDLTQPSDEEISGKQNADNQGHLQEGSLGLAAKNSEKIDHSGADLVDSKQQQTEVKEPQKEPDLKNGASTDPLRDIVLDELPLLVRSKLKKLVKYEEKYPVLLEAFKTEKRKGELIQAFEKVMSETTPVLSISDVDILVDYLEGLSEKATLLTTELRNAASDSSKLAKEKDDLAKKLADAQKTLRYAEEKVGQKAKAEEELKAKIEHLERKINTLETENGATTIFENNELDGNDDSGEIERLREEVSAKGRALLELDKTSNESKKEPESLLRDTRSELATFKTEAGEKAEEYEKQGGVYKQSQAELIRLQEDLEAAEKSVEKYKAQSLVSPEIEKKLELAQLALQKLEKKIGKLEQQISTLQSENEALKSALEIRLKDAEASSSRVQTLVKELEEKSDDIDALTTKLAAVEKELTYSKAVDARPTSTSNKKQKGKKNHNNNNSFATLNGQHALKKNVDLTAELEAAATEKTKLQSEIDDLKQSLDTKNGQLSRAFDDLKSELELKENSLKQLKQDLEEKEKLIIELQSDQESTDNLKKALVSAKREIEEKNEDLESLRDLLKDVGNELVSVKDNVKQKLEDAKAKWKAEHELNLSELSKTLRGSLKESERVTQKLAETEKLVKSNEAEIARLNKDLENVANASKTAETKLGEVQKSFVKADGELTKAKKECANLSLEESKLNERIRELSKLSADSSLKLEVASLQASVSHKDEQITDLKTSLERKEKERDDLKNTIATLKASNADLHATNHRLASEKAKMVEKQELVKERANALSAEISKLQASRQKTVTELDALKLKHEALQKTRANASDEILEYRQQHEELAMKSKEAQNRIDDLQDELSEAKSLLQERTRESLTLRRMFLEAEEEHTAKCNELRSEIRSMGDEQGEVEAGFQMLMKKRQREIDELKSLCERYLAKIAHLEKTCEDVKQKYESLNNSRHELSSEDLQKQLVLENTVDELRASLQMSSKKVKDYENLNDILKKLNEESTMKFERLSKNYKHMTQQYRQMKETQVHAATHEGPAHSSKSNGGKNAPEANVAYLKNVLVGFLEHKEQREQLLPVLKMLFEFDAEDERKFMLALR